MRCDCITRFSRMAIHSVYQQPPRIQKMGGLISTDAALTLAKLLLIAVHIFPTLNPTDQWDFHYQQVLLIQCWFEIQHGRIDGQNNEQYKCKLSRDRF